MQSLIHLTYKSQKSYNLYNHVTYGLSEMWVELELAHDAK